MFRALDFLFFIFGVCKIPAFCLVSIEYLYECIYIAYKPLVPYSIVPNYN